jgi:hypothetical protein
MMRWPRSRAAERGAATEAAERGAATEPAERGAATEAAERAVTDPAERGPAPVPPIPSETAVRVAASPCAHHAPSTR